MTRSAYPSIADLPLLDPNDPFVGAKPLHPSFRADPHARLARLLRDVPTERGASLFRVLGRLSLQLSV